MKNNSITFEIEGLPPSVNHAMNQARNGRRYPSKELVEWKARVSELDITKILNSEWYEVERIYYFPLYFKNGNKRRKDVANLDKYADDLLCSRLVTYDGRELDDREIKTGSHDKQNCEEGKERTVWTIWGIGESA